VITVQEARQAADSARLAVSATWEIYSAARVASRPDFAKVAEYHAAWHLACAESVKADLTLYAAEDFDRRPQRLGEGREFSNLRHIP
jgi:hypothetical protein